MPRTRDASARGFTPSNERSGGDPWKRRRNRSLVGRLREIEVPFEELDDRFRIGISREDDVRSVALEHHCPRRPERRETGRRVLPAFVRAAFVRPGATVIDVGINLVTDAGIAREIFHECHPRRGLFERKGSVLVGDVHPDVAEVAGAVTPVPGGVGPLTIAMLMANTIKAAELRLAAGR